MHVLTLPREGTSRLGVYRRDPPSEGTSYQQKIGCTETGHIPVAERVTPSEGNPTTEDLGTCRTTEKGMYTCLR